MSRFFLDSGCLIQSDFKSGDHGNVEVVVLEGHEGRPQLTAQFFARTVNEQ